MTPQEIVDGIDSARSSWMAWDTIENWRRYREVIESAPARIESLLTERTEALQAEIERLRAALERRQAEEVLRGQ